MSTPYPALSNALLSRFRKLKQRKYRDLEGKFLAEGLRTVEQIVTAGMLEIDCIVVLDAFASGPFALPSVKDVYTASHEQFSALTDTEQSQGVVAVVNIPDVGDISVLEAVENGVLMALDAIQDPGNMGALYRSAAWFGAKGFLLGKGSVDLFNPKTVRSTAGALGAVPVVSSKDFSKTFENLIQLGWTIYLLDAGHGSIPLPEVMVSPKSVLVIGNEGNGIDSNLLNDTRYTRVVIPGYAENVESLNAAISGSIALYSFRLK